MSDAAIDRTLIDQIDERIDEVSRALLRFWRPPQKDFWRDTSEMKKRRPNAYYPTATFMSVACLHELDSNEFGRVNIAGLGRAYNYWSWLNRLKSKTVDAMVRSSDIAAAGEVKRSWNLYTAVWAVRALIDVRQTLLRRGVQGGLSNDRIASLVRWIDKEVRRQCTKLLEHLEGHAGGSLPGYGVHPFLTAHAIDALSRTRLMGISVGKVSRSAARVVTRRGELELRRILTEFSSGAGLPGDLIALTYHAYILHIVDRSRHRNIIDAAVRLVCRSHADVGGWPLGRSWIRASGGHGVQISSFDLGSILVEMSLVNTAQVDASSDGHPDQERAFLTLFKTIRPTMTTIEAAGQEFRGWCNDHMYGADTVEAWTTSCVGQFLRNFRRYAQQRSQRATLTKYHVIWPRDSLSSKPLKRLDEPNPRSRAIRFIQQHYVDTVLSRDGLTVSLPNKRARNVSVILFGPPGTSKTTIAQSLAKSLDWPLVIITPSLFLSRGKDAIDAQATAVFGDLMTLERVIIFFDECDELFRQRTDASGGEELSEAALITGAMLPRVQDLHDRGRLILVIATNRLIAIDRAVRRDGRIDHIIGIGPPVPSVRRKTVNQHVPKIPKPYLEQIVRATEGFTFSELSLAVEFLKESLVRHPRVSYAESVASLTKTMPEEARSITADEQRSFLDLQRIHCHAWRHAHGRKRR